MTNVMTSAGPIDVVEHRSPSGPPVLFVHPFMTNARHWRKVVPFLSGIRAITPTFPFGSHTTPMHADADLSPPGLARIAIDVLDKLGVERATLVGNDTGGAVAQVAATRFADRVSGLVLTSCDAYDIFPPRMFSFNEPALIAWGPRTGSSRGAWRSNSLATSRARSSRSSTAPGRSPPRTTRARSRN